VYGHRPAGTNPCRGIRRYRRKGRERFLSEAELRRLGATLSLYATERPWPAALVRLLLLTGCRAGEIRTLLWRDLRDGHLHLRDSKTGPRIVWLSAPSRDVLAGLEDVRLHDLRHTNESMESRTGETVPVVEHRLCRKDSESTLK